MDTNNQIKQSQVRVVSGVRLVIFFSLLSVFFFSFEIYWAMKVNLVLAAFFFMTIIFEIWNISQIRRSEGK